MSLFLSALIEGLFSGNNGLQQNVTRGSTPNKYKPHQGAAERARRAIQLRCKHIHNQQ